MGGVEWGRCREGSGVGEMGGVEGGRDTGWVRHTFSIRSFRRSSANMGIPPLERSV